MGKRAPGRCARPCFIRTAVRLVKVRTPAQVKSAVSTSAKFYKENEEDCNEAAKWVAKKENHGQVSKGWSLVLKNKDKLSKLFK